MNPGPLVDRELELVPPQPRWLDELLEACRHPLTLRDAPVDSRLTRDDVERFLARASWGMEPADPSRGRVPCYHFWMLLRHGPGGPADVPPVRIAGGINLRVGVTRPIELYYGNFGYHVYPAARGQRYAERACRLLLPLARWHRMGTLWITCNPDNLASRRTCERLGARLVEVVAVPKSDPLYARGETEKCRYLLQL